MTGMVTGIQRLGNASTAGGASIKIRGDVSEGIRLNEAMEPTASAGKSTGRTLGRRSSKVNPPIPILTSGPFSPTRGGDHAGTERTGACSTARRRDNRLTPLSSYLFLSSVNTLAASVLNCSSRNRCWGFSEAVLGISSTSCR